MSISSNPSDPRSVGGSTFAVGPVVDCEPPARDVRQCRPPSPAALRKRNTHVPQRHSTQPATPLPLPMRQAASFADAAIRRVLEVIDRRRPTAALNGVLAPGSSTRCCRPTAWSAGSRESRYYAGCGCKQ